MMEDMGPHMARNHPGEQGRMQVKLRTRKRLRNWRERFLHICWKFL